MYFFSYAYMRVDRILFSFFLLVLQYSHRHVILLRGGEARGLCPFSGYLALSLLVDLAWVYIVYISVLLTRFFFKCTCLPSTRAICNLPLVTNSSLSSIFKRYN